MDRFLRGAAFAALFVLAACDAPRATGVEGTNLSDAAPIGHAILDGANGGNPYAFILSPLGADPAASAVGEFDDDVEPTVELCELNVAGDACAAILTVSGSSQLARWTVDAGPNGDVITVDSNDELYQAQLRLGLFDLAEGQIYRVQVRVDQNVLAAADIMLTGGNGKSNGNGKGKGKNKGGSGTVVPPNTYAISSGNRTIPFKFRLDDGALCWDAANPLVIKCTSVTVQAGTAKAVVLTTSGGGQVILDLPSGWVGDVNGEGVVDDITLTIEEVATTQVGGETSCFQVYTLGDPDFGNPEHCFDVRADTDQTTDVDVDFTSSVPPVLAFCPDPDVLAAITGGNDNFLMTSIQQDASGQVAKVYPNVAPPSGFAGCAVQTAAATPVGRFFASAWDRVRPAVNAVLPQPLHASARADLGFGGQILRLSTIFFWSRMPESIAISPSSGSVELPGAPLQLTVDEMFHDGPPPVPVNVVSVNWASSNPSVATVDTAGLVTPVALGTATITATATNVKGFNNQFMSASSAITVVPPAFALTNFSAMLGGTSGNPGYADCPAGQIAVGLQGTATSWYGWKTFFGVGVICSNVDASGVPTGPTTTVGSFGDGGDINFRDGDTPFSLTCSSGLMVDLVGYNNSGWVGAIEVGCYSAADIAANNVGQVPAASGFSVQSAIGVGPGIYGSGTCSAGHVATGIDVRDGNILDAIAFRCSPISGLVP